MDVEFLFIKGKICFEFEWAEEAIKCFDKVIELNPKNAGGWGNKGNALGHLGKHEESIKCYDKALELGASDEGLPDDRVGGKIYAAYIRDLDGNKIGFLHRPKS